MKIILNGRKREVAAKRLSELLEELELTGDHVATAVNGLFVARGERSLTPLSEDDRIEVLTPMQGG